MGGKTVNPEIRKTANPVFSPDTALRCRRSWSGKEESVIRPAPRSGGYCMFLPSVGVGLRQLGLSMEDRIVGSDAVQGATYGAVAGGW